MSTTVESNEFDLIVIGAGSGGISCARRAASYGAKVAVIEYKALGGTCVNVGCVPKKVMWNASYINEVIHDAKHFGYTIEGVKFDWNTLQKSRDTYIRRLNKIYENNLESSKVTRIEGFGKFAGPETVQVGDKLYKSKNIIIAVGGMPTPLDIPGAELAIDSDGFFALEHQPKKAAVIGAGYIAVELAGVLNGLGTETSLFVRKLQALRNFDNMIRDYLDTSMKKSGINLVNYAIPQSIVKEADGTLTLTLENGQVHSGFDCIISAIGRRPMTSTINLESVQVQTKDQGAIVVDEFQNTSTPGIYAIGDIIEHIQLTPMAIAAGRRLADRLFGGMPKAKADYHMVPTVVFSHPTIGTIGFTEEEAVAKFGFDHIKVYTSTFVNLWYGPFYGGGVGDKPFTKYKLVTLLPDERVIGLHAIGQASDEVIQGFAVAMKMGATKADFDNAVAIHPTAAEEFVTMPPWGLSPRAVESFK